MEQKIDEAAVWKRVTAASKTPPEPKTPQTDALYQVLVRGKALEEGYRTLSRSGRKGYSTLVQGQVQENQSLMGVYYLRHRQKPALPNGQGGRSQNYVNLLCRLLEQQGQQQEQLLSLSTGASGCEKALWVDLAGKASQRWSSLVQELGR